MNQTKVQLIARSTEIYLNLKHLLGQDDIRTCHVERWAGKLLLPETDRPHLVVLDCPGSGVEGLTVCQKIRKQYSGLLVLFQKAWLCRHPR